MADQFYIEEGYVVDDYFGYIAEAEVSLSGAFSPSFTVNIADDTGYFIPDYIADGYIVGVVEASATLNSSVTISAQGGFSQTGASTLDSAFTQSASAIRTRDAVSNQSAAFGQISNIGKIHATAVADLSGALNATLIADAFKNHTAIMDVAFAQVSDVNLTAGGDVVLDNLVNLSLQGDRTRGYSSALSSAASQTALINKIADTTATPNTEFTLTADVLKVKQATADLSALASQLTAAIEFIPKTYPYNRPHTFKGFKVYSGGETRDDTILSTNGNLSFIFDSDYPVDYYPIAIVDTLPAVDISSSDDFVVRFKYSTHNGFKNTNRILDIGRLGPVFLPAAVDGTDGAELFTSYISIRALNDTQGIAVYLNESTSPILADSVTSTSGNFVLQRENGTLKLYRNNVLLDSVSNSTAFSNIEDFMIMPRNYETGLLPTTFDYVLFRVGSSDISLGSDDNTVVYNQFDNLTGDADWNLYGDATLSTSASLTATGSVSQSITAALNAEFTQTIDVGIIQISASLLASSGTISTQANVLTATNADLASNTTISCVADRIRTTTFSASAENTISIDARRIRLLGPYTLNGVLDTSITTQKIPFFIEQLDSAFTQTVTADKIKRADATLNSEFAQTATANRTRSALSSLNTAFAQTATIGFLQTATTNFDSVASQLTAVARIARTILPVDMIATLTTSASVIPKFEETVNSKFGLTADLGRIRPGASSVHSAFSQTADVGKLVDVDSTQAATATITIDAVKVIISSSALNVAFTQTATAERTRSSGAQLSSEFAQTATATVTLDASADYSTQFDQVTNVIKSVNAAATLNALNNFTLTARSIRLDDIVYVIPSETRTFQILPSLRTYSIPQETRTLSVNSETRVHTVTEETRTHIVEGA